MASQSINMQCWKCGHELMNLLLPFSRQEECSHCNADLHACIACSNFDESVSDACREDRADYVQDKERANFCDFFQVNPKAYRKQDSGDAATARAQLADLFGEEATESRDGETNAGAADNALNELKRLFGDED